ncbi:hypothetical protein, partial [Xanthomonas citri]|uniref:hypothetical protein n=1 Tax=Xanthomonas citri TaxID=346 RepID=UPI0035ED61A5
GKGYEKIPLLASANGRGDYHSMTDRRDQVKAKTRSQRRELFRGSLTLATRINQRIRVCQA